MTKYANLLNRRRDDEITYFSAANEAFQENTEGENVKYALGAMAPINSEYTQNTFKQCARVENQLGDAYSGKNLYVTFDHQGSVTNDTHIRARSDIDLLSILNKFVTLELPNLPSSRYIGDPIADLREVRRVGTARLRSSFPQAKVDESGAKSVRISGGSLTREVDVVSCAWWDTKEYVATKDKTYRGIGVLDNENGVEIFNKPFLHNSRIQERDEATDGRARKAARLLKTLKYDSEGRVRMSSYDIVSIAVGMWDTVINDPSKPHDLQLLEKCESWLNVLIYLPDHRNALMVPNGTRKVFCSEGTSLEELIKLSAELGSLVNEVKTELAAGLRLINEVTASSSIRPSHFRAY